MIVTGGQQLISRTSVCISIKDATLIRKKVLGLIIYRNVIDFISPLISPLQFGLLRGRSTLQQLLIFFQFGLHSLDNRLQVDFLYIDLRKAFDSVPHSELLYKLWTLFGTTHALWKWFRAYLFSKNKLCLLIAVSPVFFQYCQASPGQYLKPSPLHDVCQ